MKVIFSKGCVTGRWSWTLYSANGRIIAKSRTAMDGYSHRIDCIKSFQRIRKKGYIQGVVQDKNGQPTACYGL